MPAWIEIKDARKNVDDFQLGPVNLEIEAGTITALVGTNGSGKSTLLKLMMNLANMDGGMIRILGKPVDGGDESWKRHITFQPQKQIGWNAYTGNELKNLIAPLYVKWDDKLFEHITGLFDIPLNKRFGKLSPGMQQKLSLALALPRKTDILILDEPTASLDIPSKKLFMDLLVDWMEPEDRAVVLATHQPDDLRKLADYLFLMQDGQGIGLYEKDVLTSSYRRYWLTEMPADSVPGELSRDGRQLISQNPDATEQFIVAQNIQVLDDQALELEDIISLLLK
ncbi:ATP-binding cassette domain-containing protein [Planococcus ruber]|uniref:ATP-binding cassette domain-containing protein n=1 Tax=Planococcus ruber TaxID=2027871 RepID=UPI001FEE6970|nr:ABC transporter ATP-binding protein [Planococcus ruber]MCJ1907723.1 ABC transporter ATP-binding protein [Planococcus ruber]